MGSHLFEVLMKRLLAALSVLALCGSALAQTRVVKAPWGKMPDGSTVELYTLTDARLTIAVTTFGAHITSIQAPDRAGSRADIVLGYNDFAGYLADNKTYLGSVVGRYGNRIGKGRFTVGGKPVQLDLNNNGNTLHGGTTGFDRHNWTGKQIPNGVELTLVSKDGDMGFPGTLTAHVKYQLLDDKLSIDYSATTDQSTVLNLTQHTYFNLAGKGDILSQTLQLNADRYTPTDAGLIPTGQLAPVEGTPFDFTRPTAIGARIHTPNEQLKLAGGYDHNWIVTSPHPLGIKPVAILADPASGRVLKIFTVEPAIQFYSGNFLDGSFHGRSGDAYQKYAGLCLESQHYPDSPNHPDWPSTTLTPGKIYHTTTIWQFTTQK